MTKYKVDFNAISWESPAHGLRFKAIQDNGKQIRLVEYSKDMEPHWCEKGHMGYVLEGILEVTFDNGVVTYNAGDGLIIPDGKDHKHMGKVIGEKAKLIMYETV